MSTRPDCYACRYRAAVPGDTHSECRHPAATLANGIGFLATALAQLAPDDERPLVMDSPPTDDGPPLHVAFAAHGVRNGWAVWPLNYDPTWLRACSGWAPQPKLEDEHAS